MRRALLLVLAGLVLIGVALLLAQRTTHRDEQPVPAAAVAEPPVAAPVLKPPSPSFDIVRVTPEGRTVIAGRATAHATVTVVDGETELGQLVADDRGEWVLVPDKPLQPGPHRLTLRAIDGLGRRADSEAPVVVAVPDRASPGEVVAVKLAPDGVEVLQTPPAAQPATIAIEAATQLAQDAIFFAGRAPAGTRLQLYYDDRHLGSVVADRSGRWRLATTLSVAPGLHVVRADQIGAGGVEARAEVLLDHGGLAALAPGQSVVIERNGDRWRIGHDGRPTTVYRAGAEQQRDPAPIRPGQVP